VIILDLPAPISVNETRRINWRAKAKIDAWTRDADAHFLLRKRKCGPAILGQFEITITLPDGSQTDADNAVKGIIDAVRRFRLVPDDNPKFMRRVVIEFGEAPTGCRVMIRPLQQSE
jgi:Holliday junction resolvase RusA-like endonuclease